MNTTRGFRNYSGLFLILVICQLLVLAQYLSADEPTQPGTLALTPKTLWDVDRLLNTPPEARYGDAEQREGCEIQPIWYAAEPYRGGKTEVFAYLGRPTADTQQQAAAKQYPAVLLVHGGGGKAFDEWVEHWAKRGYVALAMDLAGCGPDGKRHEHAGPGQQDRADKFCDFDRADPLSLRDVWTYHAISDILLAHALLASRDDVDADRIAVTGISWGGYLTCILSGVDPKLAAAVPVYGCGFLHENSCWLGEFAQMNAQKQADWVTLFDPGQYLCDARCPMLFVNGTNDFAYPLDSYKKSYELVKRRNPNVGIAVEIERPHSHIWTFPEVDAWIDAYCRPAEPLPALSKIEYGELVRYSPEGCTLTAKVDGTVPIDNAVLCYTNDGAEWNKRKWSTVPAEIRGHEIVATLPGKRAAVAFLLVTDSLGRKTSTPHHEFPDAEQYAVFEGAEGKPGSGKHIVLISGDEEYRSEQMQTQLAKILARHHGFRCTVLYAIDPKSGEIDPVIVDNIPGLETLETADLVVMFLRFRNLPDEQMRHIARYLESGKPLIGLRTSTHAFNIPPGQTWSRYSFNYRGEDGESAWDGGFGRRVLGETWIDHHGHHKVEATRGLIAPGAEKHPVVTGCDDIFCPTDVYTVRLPLPGDSKPLVLGQVLAGMQPTDKPLDGGKHDPMMPVLWTKTYCVDDGKPGRAIASTMGSGLDMQSEGFRRLMVNSCYWLFDMTADITPDSCVDLVGEYHPLGFGFGQSEIGVRPRDLAE